MQNGQDTFSLIELYNIRKNSEILLMTKLNLLCQFVGLYFLRIKS